MSDRYSDRRDSYEDYYGDEYYGDERYSRYSDGQGRSASTDRRRTTRTNSSRTTGSAENYSRTYSGQSGTYRSAGSTRSSSGAGAYSDTRSAQASADASQRRRTQASANTSQRHSQAGTSARRQASSGTQPYNPEASAETYSRSAYGRSASGSSASHARTRTQGQASDYASGRTVVPAQRKQAAHGTYGTTGVKYEPKRSNGKRNAIIAVIVVLAVVLVGVAAAWAYVSNISQNLHEGIDQETLDALEPASTMPTALADTPFYMLLMGVDTSANRVAYEEDSDTSRSDSMILARVDPVNKKVSLISIHRDTMVDLGEYGDQKINAAYQYWGAAGAIDAVSKMAGVPITHYASVDFDGFRAIVDSLGGIEVNVPMEINDPDADPDYGDGHLDAGLQTLDGKQALILCRSRHSYDEVADDGDVMRAANQRMVIGAIAKKILASDVMTIASTVQTMSQYITTDLEISDIIGLAQLFQGIDPDADIYTAMEPTTSAYIDDIWYEYLDEAAWQEMISRMDQGLAPVNKNEVDDATGVILSTGGLDAPKV